MHYKFPIIEHLDQVLPAIEGRDEFIVADRGDYKVVNYLVNMADTFPAVDDELMAIRRECRGLVFDANGKILSRRFHKFFNAGEKDETQFHKIDLKKPHRILEKLDGSMVTPLDVHSNFRIRMATKMGFTDVADEANKFVSENLNYRVFMHEEMMAGYTPIFEFCSRKNRVVIDYPEPRMVLLASRNNITGEYLDYHSMMCLAQEHNVECVGMYPGTAESMNALVDDIRGLQDIEGYVLRFDDGHMVKIKADQYVLHHGAIDAITQEKNVLAMVLDNSLDDVKALLKEDDYQRIANYAEMVYNGIDATVAKYENYFAYIQHLSKKDFALLHMPTAKKAGIVPAIIFSMYDGKNARDLIINTIRSNLSTQSKVDSIRGFLGGAQYVYE